MSEKKDGQYIYILEDGVLRTSPAYLHFPKRQPTLWERIIAWIHRNSSTKSNQSNGRKTE